MKYSKPFEEVLEDLPASLREKIKTRLGEFKDFDFGTIFEDREEKRLMASDSLCRKFAEWEKNLPDEERIRLDESYRRSEQESFKRFREFYRAIAGILGLEKARDLLYAAIDEYAVARRGNAWFAENERKQWQEYINIIMSKK